MKDRRTIAVGRLALDTCTGAFEALVDKLTDQFPNETDREEFAQSVINDLQNPDYRLYTWLYVSLRLHDAN